MAELYFTNLKIAVIMRPAMGLIPKYNSHHQTIFSIQNYGSIKITINPYEKHY